VLSGVWEENRLIQPTAAVRATQAGSKKTRREVVMNYYEVAKKVQEQKDTNYLKAIKKDKKFWADPMCYPVLTA
jgi:hypothetical protein